MKKVFLTFKFQLVSTVFYLNAVMYLYLLCLSCVRVSYSCLVNV